MAKVFQSFNPKTNSPNSTLHEVSSNFEIENALLNAWSVRHLWGQIKISVRVSLFTKIQELLISKKAEISLAYQSESGLSEQRFEVEFARTIAQLEHFKHFLSQFIDKEIHFVQHENFHPAFNPNAKFTKRLIPLGPVLVLGASNFPLAYSTIGGDSVAALSAGCPVIVKAHPMHIDTSTLVADCVRQALHAENLPESIFQHLKDDGYRVTQQLMADERIKAVGFTGSQKGGFALVEMSEKRTTPIPVFAEMGSCNPVIISKDAADLKGEEIAKKMAYSVCNDAGQFCTKPGIIFIPNNAKEFKTQLLKEIGNQPFFTMLHPTIKANYEHRIAEIEKCISIQFYEDYQSNPNLGKKAVGYCSVSEFLNLETLREEVFGPFTLLVNYETLNELIEVIQKLNGQLTFSLFDTDPNHLRWLEIKNLIFEKTGRYIENGVPTGVFVNETMNHGGPFPATSNQQFTAVGSDSVYRFLRPITVQSENLV